MPKHTDANQEKQNLVHKQDRTQSDQIQSTNEIDHIPALQRAMQPSGILSPSDARVLQRAVGNQAFGQLVQRDALPEEEMQLKPMESRGNTTDAVNRYLAGNEAIQRKKSKSDFSDFDSKQFRVSGKAPDRKVEEVKRTVDDEGKVVYFATGLVTGYKGKEPIITPYDDPVSLGDWYPQVTHINGMNVAPKSGIGSAIALQDSINEAMGGDTDVAMGQEAVDVLYTYSAQRGGLMADLWDCIKGKVSVDDDATHKQEEIMLDAVHRQKRTTVSAHSRGTIKTDNAVRNVHKKLSAEFLPEVKAENFERAVEFWEANDPGLGLDLEDLAEMSMVPLSEEKAKQEMNMYIQLIYAGNAVEFPSSVLKVDMFVGGLDFVSMFVGTYSEIGRKAYSVVGAGGGKGSKVHSVGAFKGHGFSKNYASSVGQTIADDIQQR